MHQKTARIIIADGQLVRGACQRVQPRLTCRAPDEDRGIGVNAADLRRPGKKLSFLFQVEKIDQPALKVRLQELRIRQNLSRPDDVMGNCRDDRLFEGEACLRLTFDRALAPACRRCCSALKLRAVGPRRLEAALDRIRLCGI